MRGNSKYLFFLLFPLPPHFLLLSFPLLSLFLSVPSPLIHLHRLLPVLTLLLPHHTGPDPCVVASSYFRLRLFSPILSFPSHNGHFLPRPSFLSLSSLFPNGRFLLRPFFPFLSFLPPNGASPSSLLSSCGRR